jgi:thioredoxin 1
MNQPLTGPAPQHVETLLGIHTGPVLIDCYSPGCGPCAALSPVLDDIARAYDGRLSIEKIDVAALPDVATQYGVRGVPTLLLFKDGQLKASRTGGASRTQLLTWLAAQEIF